MILKEMMSGNTQFNQVAAFFQTGSQNTQNSGLANEHKAFADILNNRMDSTAGRNYVKKNEYNAKLVRENRTENSKKEEYGNRYLTFRDANKRNSEASALNPVDGKKTHVSEKNDILEDESGESSKRAAAKETQSDSLLNVFAQIMGLNTAELQKLLKEAGISSEAFSSMENAEENIAKLSQLLGLNSEQQETLAEIFRLTAELTAERESTAGAGNSLEDLLDQADLPETAEEGKNPGYLKSSVKLETGQPSEADIQGKQPMDSALEDFMQKLSIKIKVKLYGMKDELKNDKIAVKIVIRQMVQALQQKPQEISELQMEANNDEATGKAISEVEAAGKEAEASDEYGTEQENNTGYNAAVMQPAEDVPMNAQETFAVLQTGKMSATDAVDKISPKIPVSPSAKEIINQVIEKAKVVMTPDKAEMAMELQPDSLGRISLKVITENGIVTARFIADNQQVKQVLETNMQLLKDSLEKQGMNVQGFSVSVRQDSNRQAYNGSRQENGKSGRSTAGTSYRTEGLAGSIAESLSANERGNPHLWGGSTINLTA